MNKRVFNALRKVAANPRSDHRATWGLGRVGDWGAQGVNALRKLKNSPLDTIRGWLSGAPRNLNRRNPQLPARAVLPPPAADPVGPVPQSMPQPPTRPLRLSDGNTVDMPPAGYEDEGNPYWISQYPDSFN